MNEDDVYMTFIEALDGYIDSREIMRHTIEGGTPWIGAKLENDRCKEHLEWYTSKSRLRSSISLSIR